MGPNVPIGADERLKARASRIEQALFAHNYVTTVGEDGCTEIRAAYAVRVEGMPQGCAETWAALQHGTGLRPAEALWAAGALDGRTLPAAWD